MHNFCMFLPVIHSEMPKNADGDESWDSLFITVIKKSFILTNPHNKLDCFQNDAFSKNPLFQPFP